MGTVCPVNPTRAFWLMGMRWLARKAGICIWGCRWEVVESIEVFWLVLFPFCDCVEDVKLW